MDGRAAIELNREALRRILGSLLAMAGLRLGGEFTFFPQKGTRPENVAPREESKLSPALPRHLYLAILQLLRPAEAAARRLVLVLAQALPALPYQPRPRKPKPRSIFVKNGAGTGIVLPSGMRIPGAPVRRDSPLTFRFLDPPRRPARHPRAPAVCVPRIAYAGLGGTLSPIIVRPPPSPDDRIDTTRLSNRFAALAIALDDLPAQARRLARWRARNDYRRNRGQIRTTPLRWGRPPGGRLSVYDPTATSGHRIREVDHVLAHCHDLALFALARRDTS